MDFKNNKRITIPLVVLLLIFSGLLLFIERENEDFPKEENIVNKEFNGNLIINNPGLDEGWNLSYSEVGKPGLIKKLIIEEEGVNCIGDGDICTGFFKKDEELAGSRVIVSGKAKEEEIKVDKIDFNLKKEGCNFDFEDFKTEKVTINNPEVDFETKPDAFNFETKIREAVDGGPNFAGRYVYAGWGCGTNCESAAIVNAKTGEIVEYGLINSLGADYKVNSRLLILNPKQKPDSTENEGVLSEVKSKYFLMGEDQLLLLCEE
jgi:hypothetical protein